MEEYIGRNALLQEIANLKKSPWYNDDYGFGTKQARHDGVAVVEDLCIKQAPIADVVEVVRCKDCLFGHRDYDYEYGYTCVKPLYHPGVGEMPHRKLMQDCDYCSHGIRRED